MEEDREAARNRVRLGAIQKWFRIQGDPPPGCPALESVKGETSVDWAQVVGYRIFRDTAWVLCQEGVRRYPGDDGYTEALIAAIDGAPLPNGWERRQSQVYILVAVVAGDPVLLENQAQELGYEHGIAIGVLTLSLCELEVE